MYEVEVKVPADHDAVRAALEAAGADRRGTVASAADGFERGDDLSGDVDAVLSGSARADGETRVTYKGPLVEAESKTREEFETTIGDAEEMAAVLDGLGFEPAADVRKLRARYRLEEFTVLLDAVEDVGDYVEIETEVGGEAEVAAAREDACAVLRDLGLDPTEQVRTSYLGLRLGVDETDAENA